MAVFMDTGGGDIYAGVDKEQVLAAMKRDVGDKEFALFSAEDGIKEVSGSTKMRSEQEDGSTGELITLDDEYQALGITHEGFCICSDNC